MELEEEVKRLRRQHDHCTTGSPSTSTSSSTSTTLSRLFSTYAPPPPSIVSFLHFSPPFLLFYIHFYSVSSLFYPSSSTFSSTQPRLLPLFLLLNLYLNPSCSSSSSTLPCVSLSSFHPHLLDPATLISPHQVCSSSILSPPHPPTFLLSFLHLPVFSSFPVRLPLPVIFLNQPQFPYPYFMFLSQFHNHSTIFLTHFCSTFFLKRVLSTWQIGRLLRPPKYTRTRVSHSKYGGRLFPEIVWRNQLLRSNSLSDHHLLKLLTCSHRHQQQHHSLSSPTLAVSPSVPPRCPALSLTLTI